MRTVCACQNLPNRIGLFHVTTDDGALWPALQLLVDISFGTS